MQIIMFSDNCHLFAKLHGFKKLIQIIQVNEGLLNISRFPELESRHQILFSIIPGTSIFLGVV